MNLTKYKLPEKIVRRRVFFIVALGVIALLLLIAKRPEYTYSVSTDEMLKISRDPDHIITPAEFVEITKFNDSLYRFIDLRSPREFAAGHIKGAINIPVHSILDEKYKDIFATDEKINILYHNDHQAACGSWMLLRQIGYVNNKILLGGYKYVKGSIIDEFAPLSGQFLQEKPKYDYAAVMAMLSGGGSSAKQTSSSAKPVIKVKRKKTDDDTGGC